jgi:PEP-CTERM motif-containing protein
MRRVLACAAVAVLTCALCVQAQAATIQLGASSNFQENALLSDGFFSSNGPDNFTITNFSDPGVTITSVTIDLSTSANGVFFDPTAAAPGFGFSSVGVVNSGGPETGFFAVTGNTDGSTLLTMSFTDFDPGETFDFGIDVDHTTGIVRQTVGGFEIEGATLAVTFTGAGFGPTDLVGDYMDDTSTFFNILDAVAGVEGEVEVSNGDPIPEPATLALLGMAACGLVGFTRRRKAA